MDISIKAGGTAGGAINASIEIKFSSKHAVLFNAAGCVASSIENQVALAAEIMKLLGAGKWQKKYVVITTLIAAESTTAIASSSSSATIVLEGKTPDIKSVDLTDASVKLLMTRSKDIALEIVTAGNCTPLMGLSGVKGSVFGPDECGPLKLLNDSMRALIGNQKEQLMFMQIS